MEIFMERSVLTESFTKENLAFEKKILERSGLGQKTYLPEAVLRVPPNPCGRDKERGKDGDVWSH
ncbi:FAE1/Type III polyketide synthase-like protein [Corchorus capsularis]|uniref:FAE1/Type III polyketide synthase-like protein n=1 Tax=Corchorus capsularis TaxID=210143 RepID=A0A1R3FWK6_COCAP|nr:FAE1/Type III polyketide synthase-like protein [Corchorus capsularis]